MTGLRNALYDAAPMRSKRWQSGQANLTTILILIGLLVAALWLWKSLDFDTQDFIVEKIVPVLVLVVLAGGAVGLIVHKVRQRRWVKLRKEQLLTQFQKQTSREKRLDLAFALVELNGYRREGLESVAPAMGELFRETLKTALGDKQHRIRGKAASHLGAIQDKSAIGLLLKALEDDHAYVRSCVALALGRLRASEAKDKLTYVMKEDWDQTVRSRAREALERLV